jgi:hypothetical protein
LKRERSDEREMVREEEGNGEDERKGGEDGERRMEMRNGRERVQGERRVVLRARSVGSIAGRLERWGRVCVTAERLVQPSIVGLRGFIPCLWDPVASALRARRPPTSWRTRRSRDGGAKHVVVGVVGDAVRGRRDRERVQVGERG